MMLAKTVLLAICVSDKTKNLTCLLSGIKRTSRESSRKNWKKTTKKFDKHEASNCHKGALTYDAVLPTCGNTAEMLNKNRHSLMIVLEAIRLLAEQEHPIRRLIYWPT